MLEVYITQEVASYALASGTKIGKRVHEWLDKDHAMIVLIDTEVAFETNSIHFDVPDYVYEYVKRHATNIMQEVTT